MGKLKGFFKDLFKTKKDSSNQLELKFEEPIREEEKKIKRIHNRKVYKFDLDGNLITEYNTPKECYIENNIPKQTFYSCARKLISYHNFIYSYDIKTNIKRKLNPRKEILMYDRETKELIKEFKSRKEAMAYLKINWQYLNKIINGESIRDYILKYKED